MQFWNDKGEDLLGSPGLYSRICQNVLKIVFVLMQKESYEYGSANDYRE